MTKDQAAQALAAAFKDIVNAADNGTPYTRKELLSESFYEAQRALAVIEGAQ